ncbi:hypothetical protein G6F35_018002 [Rhizopus arrhizus]|nr:hypothetical protein G6F35_018002 [Rhizopus arrhizus]
MGRQFTDAQASRHGLDDHQPRIQFDGDMAIARGFAAEGIGPARQHGLLVRHQRMAGERRARPRLAMLGKIAARRVQTHVLAPAPEYPGAGHARGAPPP